MYYVLLETSTQHFSENPKDQTKITDFFYQIVKDEKYEFEKEQSLMVNYDLADGLQKAVDQLDKTIMDIIEDSEFALCSLFSTWTLKVILQRQAYDENVTLPKSLKHFRILDLWKEFGKFYSHHEDQPDYQNKCLSDTDVLSLYGKNDPESIRFANLLNTLLLTPESLLQGIDDDDNSPLENKISEKTNIDLAEVKNNSEIKLSSVRNIRTTTIILQKLCKFFKDDEAGAEYLLTNPDDLDLDFRMFQDEKSTILYMTNLPLDTTQSELESWFTQYGTRPTGFWTFRNILDQVANNPNFWELNHYSYVEELNSIPGFVIFQTHEDALQALNILNGRSMLSNVANTKQPRVVEHIVELLPSSNNVIDSAQEILTPFPQSKNKPRPGDWNCPSCGFLNFQRRTACFRCSFPIPSSFQKANVDTNLNSNDEIDTNKNNSTISTSNDLTNDQSETITNLHTNENLDKELFEINQKMKHLNSTSFRNNNINGSNNHNHNNNNGYSSIPFRAGDWKCGVCDYHNFAKNIVCLRCGGPKTSSTHLREPLNKINKNINSKPNYNEHHDDDNSPNTIALK